MTNPSSMGAGQPPPGPNLVGRQLGRYEIVSFIASGGMASVYSARALGMAGFERLVALKVLHPHLAHEHEFITMFLDEARLAARIRHPNVVATLDISSTEAEGFYLVMEYVEGDHLGRLMAGALRAGGGRLPVPVVLRIVADALQGLGAAHDLADADGRLLQLVHRDVSPHNLLVGLDGVARLTDFGVARAEVRLAATRDGQFKGKLGYMSPEQIAAGACDRRSDLFAMGVVLWEALAGRRLFRADDTVGMLRAVLQQPIPPLASERPELAPLDEVLSVALARKPEARYQRAAAFLDALEAVAPRVGGMAAPRQVAEAVRQYTPPRLSPQSRTPTMPSAPAGEGRQAISGLQSHLLMQSGSHPGWQSLPGSGSLSGQHFPYGSHTFSTQGNPTATGFHAPPKRRNGLVAGLAAAVLVFAGIAAFFAFRPQPATEATIPLPAAVAPRLPGEPIDASLLTGPGDAAPRLLQGDAPFVPDSNLALTPTIVLRLHLDATGEVVESHVYRPRAELKIFEEAARDAARGYRFLPAQQAGRPVAAWFNLPVTFTRPPPPTTTLQVKGSDTIGGDLGPALARAYRARNPTTLVQVEGLGSSTAFAGLFEGTADIGASSRSVNGKELATATRLGINLQEFVIGYDGIAVIVHPGNEVPSLTLDQLSRIFTGEVRNWREVGGRDLPIRVISRPSYSGTHAFFKEKVLRGGNAKGAEEFFDGTEFVQHGSDIAAAIAADASAVSYVGLGSVEKNLRVVPVAAAAGTPAASPSTETVANGSYPIYRPLLLYTRGMPTGEVARFVRFVLSSDGRRLVEAQGFVASENSAEAIAIGE